MWCKKRMGYWPYVALGVSVLFGIVAAAGFLRHPRSSRSGELEAELGYRRSVPVYLGDLLGRVRPGRRCTLVVFEGDEGFADGFREGADGRLGEIAEVTVSGVLPDGMPSAGALPVPPERAWTAANVSSLLGSVPASELVVTAVPFPASCFGPAGAPALPALRECELVLAAGCGKEPLRAVLSGRILGAVRCREDAGDGVGACPEDFREAFSARYEFVSSVLDVPVHPGVDVNREDVR